MRIFVTGTDTGIGKTLVCSWLCAHTGFEYFKPIQTGSAEDSDSSVVASLAKVAIHPEIYRYKAPVSPHWAAALENERIELIQIQTPRLDRLIIEGAGGLMVPLNDQELMIDLIQHLNAPVILVASSRLGTINHSLLSLSVLRARGLHVLGVIMSGEPQPTSTDAIEHFSEIPILATLPFLTTLTRETLLQQPLGERLSIVLQETVCPC